ncbi:MAG: DnaD domain protein [Candidatus Gastranaerophilales bacterium]|nr:DnaD domain protein [Candidatus Gastranaerophilales bacterium]
MTIYKDNNTDATTVPNLFIDKYMSDANDAQLKVYLYLLRMFGAGQATSVSDIADKFNHTEKDVIRSLKYWEKRQLLNLEYDESKNLTGILLRDLSRTAAPASGESLSLALSAQPVPDQPMPNPEDRRSMSNPEDGRPLSNRISDSAEVSYESAFAKPVYSPDQLRAFKSRENTAQLLFIAESYIGKPLSPSEMKSILFFTDVLHFSDDLIDYLLQYCVDRGKKDFKYIEKVAVNWAEAGITSPKQAQKYATRYDKNVYAIMNELGKSGSPTSKELEFINRWLREYGFSMDIIAEACERTVLATDKHRFEYAESILNSWKQENVHQKADIHRIDDLYQKQRASRSAKQSSSNKFNQFTQNHYDFDALEKELLSN